MGSISRLGILLDGGAGERRWIGGHATCTRASSAGMRNGRLIYEQWAGKGIGLVLKSPSSCWLLVDVARTYSLTRRRRLT